MPLVNCTQCGQPFHRRAYHINLTANPFCGFPCYAEWQKVHRKGARSQKQTVSCGVCGKPITRPPSGIAERNYCSRDCALQWRRSGILAGDRNPAWKGGHPSYRGENWFKQRAAARKRDQDTCQQCGRQAERLPVHHMRPFCLFDNYREANRIENLITLCPACHSRADAAFWKAHPDLLPPGGLRFPDCNPARECKRCGETFAPRSGATQICDPCCTATCQHCGALFYSRKAAERTIKFCSRACSWKQRAPHSKPRRSNSPKT